MYFTNQWNIFYVTEAAQADLEKEFWNENDS